MDEVCTGHVGDGTYSILRNTILVVSTNSTEAQLLTLSSAMVPKEF
jgi:hypothetical protein